MTSKTSLTFLIGASFLAAGPALAQEVAADPSVGPQASVEAAEPAPVGEEEMPALDEAGLKELRGGETIMVANQTMAAIVTGNVINGDYTAGNVSLSDFALSSFNGLGNLTINTGAMVSINAGMNLTINVGE